MIPLKGTNSTSIVTVITIKEIIGKFPVQYLKPKTITLEKQ